MRSIHRFAAVAAAITVLVIGTAGDTAAQVPCPGFHTVRSGDTLVSIASRCGVTVPALLAYNPAVRGNQDLRVGREIGIPHPDDPQPRPQQACGAFYTLRSGDTLAGIALKCGLTVPLLVAANGSLDEPVGIRAGRQIRIPDVPRRAIQAEEIWTAVEPLPPAPDPVDLTDLTREEGTLTSGTPCMLLRTDDDRTVALTVPPGRAFQPGDRVVVIGVPAAGDACGGAGGLDVRIVYRPG